MSCVWLMVGEGLSTCSESDRWVEVHDVPCHTKAREGDTSSFEGTV